MNIKNGTLLILILSPLLVLYPSPAHGNDVSVRMVNELPLSPEAVQLSETNNVNAVQPNEESEALFTKVKKQLQSGVDPGTPVDLLVYWEDYHPDFPDWVNVKEAFDLIPVIHVETALEDVDRLSQLRYVSKVVENQKGIIPAPTSFSYGSDPYIGEYPLYLNETHSLVDASTPASTAGAGTIIAILSTGIDDSHPMLNDLDDNSSTDDPKVLDWWNAYTQSGANPADTTGMGTALASIVAGTGAVGGQFAYNKTFDYFHRLLPGSLPLPYDTQEIEEVITVGSQLGFAPGASLFDIKITSGGGATNDAATIRGLEWAAAHGADIILLNAENRGSAVIDAIEAATNYGALVIVQAGDWDYANEADNYDDQDAAPYYTIDSPASAPSALTVGTTTETDALWLKSERGPVSGNELSKPDVVAPGVGILAANYEWLTHEAGDDWNGTAGDDSLYFRIFDSTACAAAAAAGVSAQLIANFPGASPTAIKIALRQGALDLGFNEMAQGKGKIQLGAANSVLVAAAKQANNELMRYQERNYTLPLPGYSDYENKRILVDGSWSIDTTGLSTYNWSEMTNGDLGRDTSHPYEDTIPGPTWFNASYQGAEQVRLSLANITVGSGDNITIYFADNPDGTSNTTYGGPWTSDQFPGVSLGWAPSDEIYLFIKYMSNGDALAAAAGGVWGTVELRFRTDTNKPAEFYPYEFDALTNWLDVTAMGATVEYWYPASASSPPTSIILEYYDLYILPQPRAASLSASYAMNATAYYQFLAGNISDYLTAGGNILFIGDQEHTYYNYATSQLGIIWHEGGAGGPTTNIASHPITTTPHTIEDLLIAAPLAYLSGGTPVVTDVNVPSVVVSEPGGGGKAVFVADEDVFNDDLWIDPATEDPINDNSLLAANIFYWLLNVTKDSGSFSADIGFDFSYYNTPKLAVDGEQMTVETVIQNIGNVTTDALVAFGMGWTSNWVVLGDGDGIIDNAAEDNWNNSYYPTPDLPSDVTNPISGVDTIEFHYNITNPSIDFERLALYYIALNVSDINGRTDCRFYFNNYDFGRLLATNTTTGGSGATYYNFEPNATNQPALYRTFNNITITIPAGTTVTMDQFLIRAFEFQDPSQGQVSQTQTSLLAPGAKTTLSFNYTPHLELGTNHSTSLEPYILVLPANFTWAYVIERQSGHAVVNSSIIINASYGNFYPGYWSENNTAIYAIYKDPRQGDLPLLYEITPAGLDPSTSTKIVQFPGDIRVDGLTVMSSVPLDNPALMLSGGITSVAGLGNTSMSLGIAAYHPGGADWAPAFFALNRTWERTSILPLERFNHTNSEPVLQVHVLPTTSIGTITGTLSLYSGNTSILSVSLSLTLEAPDASFLLIDDDNVDLINTQRDYDKLWDSLFEVWKIAANASYDIDSLYQETFLYEYRHNELVGLFGMDTNEYLNLHVANTPEEEELFYAALLGIGLDDSYTTGSPDYPKAFANRGGTIIELSSNNEYLGYSPPGPSFVESGSLAQALLGSSNHPLMTNVDQLLYLGSFLGFPKTTYDDKLHYEALSGLNWASGNLSMEVAGIYHDAIYPYRFSSDTGLYPYQDGSHEGELNQAYRGMQIAVGSELIAQSWFLEQLDIWGYFVMQFYADRQWISDNFTVALDNDQFIENILYVGANQAPTIENVSISPTNIHPGDEITVHVSVSDDRTPTAQLHVVGPEKLESGFLYRNFTYNASSQQFVGKFRVVEVGQLQNWNIAVWDDMYRVSWAVEPWRQHLIPALNVLPVAWTASFLDPYGSGAAIYDANPFPMIKNVEKGDLIQLPVYFQDYEDGFGITCNVSLVYYKNMVDTNTIFTETFSGTGFGMFLADTSRLDKDGTYVIIATLMDSDEGIASYRLAGFNLGIGTLFKSPADGRGTDFVVVGTGVLILGTLVSGAAGGAVYFFRRRGGY
ncbi:MAG: S8 family serine peptidase [Candidatus Heimdallarchaeota archaeon]